MSKASNIVAFIFGAAAGSVATWYVVKKKYEQIAQEEIDSVKEVFSTKDETDENEDEDEEDPDISEGVKPVNYKPSASELAEYARTIIGEGYKEDEKVETPYVITPDEFGEIEEYTQISLTYFADGVLAEGDEIIGDVDACVGTESLSHFGQYEDDSVFVRNDRLKCDYEILMDEKKYSDVLDEKPYLREDV